MAAFKTGVKISIKINVDHMSEFAQTVKALTQLQVAVGIPENSDARKKGEISNASLLYIHNNGSPAMNIPARPVMTPGVMAVKTQIETRLHTIGNGVLEGKDIEWAKRNMEGIGMIAAASIKNTINSNIGPPLSVSTLAARRHRGVTRTNTLVDSAQMRDAVTYVVLKKA